MKSNAVHVFMGGPTDPPYFKVDGYTLLDDSAFTAQALNAINEGLGEMTQRRSIVLKLHTTSFVRNTRKVRKIFLFLSRQHRTICKFSRKLLCYANKLTSTTVTMIMRRLKKMGQLCFLVEETALRC